MEFKVMAKINKQKTLKNLMHMLLSLRDQHQYSDD